MKRREFVALIGGAAVAKPLGVSAQQSRVRRIGILMAIEPADPQGVVFRPAIMPRLGKLTNTRSSRRLAGCSRGNSHGPDRRAIAGVPPRDRRAVSDRSARNPGRPAALMRHLRPSLPPPAATFSTPPSAGFSLRFTRSVGWAVASGGSTDPSGRPICRAVPLSNDTPAVTRSSHAY